MKPATQRCQPFKRSQPPEPPPPFPTIWTCISIRRGLSIAANPSGGTTSVSSHYFQRAERLSAQTVDATIAANGTGLRCCDRGRRFFRRGHRPDVETQASRGARPDHRKERGVRSQSGRIDDRTQQLLYDPATRPDELSWSPSIGETGIADVVREPTRPAVRRLRGTGRKISGAAADVPGRSQHARPAFARFGRRSRL